MLPQQVTELRFLPALPACSFPLPCSLLPVLLFLSPCSERAPLWTELPLGFHSHLPSDRGVQCLCCPVLAGCRFSLEMRRLKPSVHSPVWSFVFLLLWASISREDLGGTVVALCALLSGPGEDTACRGVCRGTAHRSMGAGGTSVLGPGEGTGLVMDWRGRCVGGEHHPGPAFHPTCCRCPRWPGWSSVQVSLISNSSSLLPVPWVQ